MKKRRRNFLQKMMAVLLSAVLIIGMSVGTVPAEVQAEENTEIVESVSENTTEIMEEETAAEPVEENKPEEETEPEDAGELEEETEPEDAAEPEETTEPEEEIGTEGAGEFEEETGSESADEPVMAKTAMSDAETGDMLMAAQADGNIASGTDWVLDGNSVLTISSDAGMAEWKNNRNTYKSQVKQAVIQNGVTSIGIQAFFKCENLTSVEIPSTVTSIGMYAFSGCGKLMSIEIPSNVTQIGTEAFRGCIWLVDVTMRGTTPPTIGSSVFTNCQFLSGGYVPGIVVPKDSVNAYKAAWSAWADYVSDGSGYDPNILASGTDWVLEKEGVLTIKSDAGMTDWKVWRDKYDYYFFVQCNNKEKKTLVKKLIIESGVTSIVDQAFMTCVNLTEVQIPDTVKNIGKGAFRSCEALTEVDFPDNLQTIGELAFAWSKVSTVTIPDNVKIIPTECFFKCPLTSITIPAGITEIQTGAFNGCELLTEVKVEGTTPPTIGGKVFKMCSFVTSNAKGIKVPTGYAETYKNAWTDWKNYIQPDTHTHNLTLVPAKTATCTEKGNSAYYTCSGCDKWFADDEGTIEIADKSGVEIAPTSHTFGSWTVTKRATESEEGLKERSCSGCGYKETEAIPKTGGGLPDSGEIEIEKEQGENTPDADFRTSKDDLISAVLTPEERSLVDAGTDVKIILDIENIDASVEEADKQAVVTKVGDFTVGQYLDINLYKIIGTDRTKVSHTNGKIKIALTIPDSLKNTDSGKTRSYAVVRVHDGVAEMLPDTDNDAATITFETDLFSTYALVYKDTVNTGNNDKNNNGSSGKDSEPKTGETTPVEICATIAMIAGFSYLLDLFGNIKGGMTEQEKKEIVASIIAWGRKGGKLRRLLALALIFAILVYYHSIGRQVDVDWKEAYGE